MVRQPAPSTRPADLALAGYALAVTVAIAQAAAPAHDAGAIARAAVPYLAGLLVVVLVRSARRRDAVAARVTVGLAVLGAGLAAWVLVRFAVALPDAIGAEHGFYRLKAGITTPLGDHNTAAGLLLVPLVASAVLAVGDRRWRVGVGLVAAGIAATLSRGAAVVLAVVVGVAYLAASRRRVATILSAALAGVLAVLFVAGMVMDTSPPPGTAPAGPASESGLADVVGASVLGRVDLAVRGLEVGRDRPLTGAGLGTFGEVAADLPEPNDHAHQMLAHAFAEGGVPLLVAVLLVACGVAFGGLRLPRSPRRDVVLFGGLGLLAHAQVEILAGRIGTEVLLACLAGLAVAGDGTLADSLRATQERSP